MSYIKVEDLSLGYDSEIVCSNINFEINKNDYLCIIGENGAGKSTLIKTILDLKEKTGHSTMAVTADGTANGKLLGVVTGRDYRISRLSMDTKVL